MASLPTAQGTTDALTSVLKLAFAYVSDITSILRPLSGLFHGPFLMYLNVLYIHTNA